MHCSLKIRGACADGDILFPLAACWPMGFAWSSSAAQYIMTSSVLETGVDTSQFLGDDHSLPCPRSTAYSVATDDVLAFEVGPRS